MNVREELEQIGKQVDLEYESDRDLNRGLGLTPSLRYHLILLRAQGKLAEQAETELIQNRKHGAKPYDRNLG